MRVDSAAVRFDAFPRISEAPNEPSRQHTMRFPTRRDRGVSVPPAYHGPESRPITSVGGHNSPLFPALSLPSLLPSLWFAGIRSRHATPVLHLNPAVLRLASGTFGERYFNKSYTHHS
ncbi:hypothetical protein E2C01_036179 [Portunus trituberculatus]|uniref:Uncharacterized protein n=1 Tax=Portunus trituberculatus TaxID=210409 RepID=A0A5B7FB74_PORTR|nr:hypothetical protein [Portunus trituberculatus]